MKNAINRRQALAAGTGLLGAAAMPLLAQTQAYPNRPITLVVPFAPGGAVDISARAVDNKVLLRLRDAMEDQGLWDEVDGAIPHRGARAEDWPLFAKRLDNAA